MNSLSALLKVCHNLPDDKNILSAYKAGRFESQTPQGNSVAEVGCEPILHMRHFQVSFAGLLQSSLSIIINQFAYSHTPLDLQSMKKLPEKLVYQILHPYRNGGAMPIS